MFKLPILAYLAHLTAIAVYGQPFYVSYIGFPTCSGTVRDAECLSALGVPGYSNHKYNVLNFAFYVASEDKLYDASSVWATPSSYFSQSFKDQIAGKSGASDWDFRQGVKALYASKGIKIVLSLFGQFDDPISAGIDATALSDKVANMVWQYNYDGVDIDFEITEYFDSGDGRGEEWLITLTRELRNKLGWGYILTHAPVAPYFMGLPNYSYGAYLKIHQQVGSMIDWYNVQFYNQFTTTYDSYETLFIDSNGWSPNSAVSQLISGANSFGISIPENKIVIGKYVRNGVDGSNGWVSADNLKQYFIRYGWKTGFMTWQFPGDAQQNFAFSNTVIEAFNSGPSPTPPPLPTSPPLPTPKPSSGGGNGNIIITNTGTLNEWWYAATVSNSAATISKFEVLYNNQNAWFSCTNEGWAWTCSPDIAFVRPLTIRLMSSNGVMLTSWSLVSNFQDQYAWDFGYNF